jgi:signal transduction histidine kinase
LYQKDNNIKQAEDCFRRAIQLTEGTNFFRILQMAYLNLGVVYDSRSDFANANLYYQKANELTLKTHDKVGQVKILHNLGKIHLDLDKYEVAYTYFTQALTNAKEIGNNELEIISLLGVAESESKLGNNQLALKYALEAEKIIPTNQTNLIKGEVYEALFNIYQLMGNVHKALDYHILYKEAQDSIFNANKSAQMSEIQTKYEVEKKETENTLLKKEKDLKDARIRQQMWIIVSSLIIIGLVVFLSIMLYRSRQKEKGINAILADQKIELESKNRLLEELNAVKDRLFSIISHDLRAPLGSLKSLLTLLNDKTLSEAQVTALFPKLSQDVGYTSDLLDSLLHWAKSQLHGIHTNPKKIDMKALVEENISLLSSIAEQKNIELTNEIGENVIVLADEDMTRTILRNLVSNALKFTKANGHIRVSAQTLREGLEVTVEDTGVGMSQEVLSQLFKGNITKRGTKNEKGTGLGLILVKDFLEKNGGTIRVESEVGKGSKFIFTLPLAEVAAAVIS